MKGAAPKHGMPITFIKVARSALLVPSVPRKAPVSMTRRRKTWLMESLEAPLTASKRSSTAGSSLSNLCSSSFE